MVVGMAAAGLPHELRRKAIVIGIGAAALLRILFAVFTTQLLNTIPIILAGGLLLLWVAWKLFRETREAVHQHHAEKRLAAATAGGPCSGAIGGGTAVPASDECNRLRGHSKAGTKTLPAALGQIVLADVSMSLDNVLAVAGTARHHLFVLIIGLALSVALMGMAATAIGGLLRRYPWISYLGLILIGWVAIAMIIEGSWQVVDFAQRVSSL